ncbi:MAG: B12-binding domain-containing radical SAM protein [Candidatus Omnitrophica bacterium]|nr:B12-binding domain-containing radical SAM protein [Candidatus Omnitrophota bacterium]
MSKPNSVLLVQSPPWGVSTVPLGVAYLSTYLRSKGISVEVLDLNINLYRNAAFDIRERWSTNEFEYWASGDILKDTWFNIETIVQDIVKRDIHVVGFSTTFASIPFLNEIIQILRAAKPDITIIVGGGGPSYRVHRNFFRKDLVDYFIIGEGEVLLYELIKQLWAGHSSFINATCHEWKDEPRDRALCLQGKRATNLDELPFPTFEEFDIEKYIETDLLPIVISRGCINACHFCCDWLLKRPYRVRKPNVIVDEIQWLVSRYGRRRFEFSDLLVNGDLQNFETLCDLLIRRKINIVWGGQATVRSEMTQEHFLKMKEAGCGGLTFGFESFSNSLLKKMNKHFTAADAAGVIRRAKKAGMLVEANFVVGFPGEQESDIDETITFLKENRAFIDRVNSLNICSIGPGMNIWERAEDFGINKDIVNDWYAWHTEDKQNTIEIRIDRHKRLKTFIETEGFGLSWQNIRKNEQEIKRAV